MKKKIMVTRSSMPELDEYIEEIRPIWESHWLTNMGEKHIALQRQLEKYLHVKKIELLTNGHMALEIALQALNLEGEVITTPFTFASTTHAIARNGLTPVFCDINSEDYTIDVEQIEKLITPKTCAIMPTHVYGNICDVEQIETIAKKYGLKVVYDAAHAFGETYKGRGVGSFGDASCFSFHATKVFNTIEGGAIAFSEETLGESIYYLKNFGIKDEENVVGVGTNAKMNEFQAAMGLCNLRHVEREIGRRKEVYSRYMELLDGIPGIRLNKIQKDVKSNYSYFPVVVEPEKYGKTRDELQNYLQKQEIYARKYFYPLTNQYPCYKKYADSTETPVADRISKNVLTIPMYADLSLDDVNDICQNIVRFRKI